MNVYEQPPSGRTVGGQYFRGRNDPCLLLLLYAANENVSILWRRQPRPPTSVSECPKGYSETLLAYGIPNPGYPTPSGQSPSIRSCLCYLNAPQKNSFYICIVIPTRKDSSPGTRSRSPPWPSMIFRTEESPIP